MGGGGNGDVRKLHWVAWETVATPKDKGGLGVSRLFDCNRALISKWLWRCVSEKKSMWKGIINAIHCSKRKWDMFPINGSYSSGWINIVKEGYKLKVNGSSFIRLIKCEVGNGEYSRFWVDDWAPFGVLKEGFPALFKLEVNKHCAVCERLTKVGDTLVNIWSWKKHPSTPEEVQQMLTLLSLLQQVRFKQGADLWKWGGHPSGSFSVAVVRNWLASSRPVVNQVYFDWCKWVPIKCNIFMWRLLMKRLPTKVALLKRNILIDDSRCAFCGDGDDEVDHVFTGCAFAASVWNGILGWLGIPNYFSFSVSDLGNMHKIDGLSATRKDTIRGMVMVCCWRIWRARNDVVFNHRRSNVVEVAAEVKAFGFLWFSNRHKDFVKDWKGWSNVMLL
ncbi:putative reverse transcriptase zinc-binding domain-containing protein [Helianthus anomalus]